MKMFCLNKKQKKPKTKPNQTNKQNRQELLHMIVNSFFPCRLEELSYKGRQEAWLMQFLHNTQEKSEC